MKHGLLYVALAFLVVIGLATGGVISLNRPLGPGLGRPTGPYVVRVAHWTDMHEWYFGTHLFYVTALLPSNAVPAGVCPCVSTPVARVIQIGPITITH
jgi:hypothetical protein